jgi:hypothetical protein
MTPDPLATARAALLLLQTGRVAMAQVLLEQLPAQLEALELLHHDKVRASYDLGRADGEAGLLEKLLREPVRGSQKREAASGRGTQWPGKGWRPSLRLLALLC